MLAEDAQSAVGAALPDDLARDVYCILGLPIDAVELPEVLRRVDAAVLGARPFLISTVNVNFLVTKGVNAEFRDSICLSDLCTADGTPIVWISRLLSIPIKCRVAGSDMFEALRASPDAVRPLRLFLFGGAAGTAAAAAEMLNSTPGKLRCVGALDPGFGSVEAMCGDDILDAINSSGADFLIVALGAAKGQAWLLRNHHRLRPPVRSHLGAAVNFTAGTVKRSPRILRTLGLEWLWRIKEEPHLWRRYWNDGGVLIGLFISRILPLIVTSRLSLHGRPQRLIINETQCADRVILRFSGHAIERFVPDAVRCFRQAIAPNKQLVINFAGVGYIDSRFFGLLLMLKKQLEGSGKSLEIAGISARVARLFWLNGLEFLLPENDGV